MSAPLPSTVEATSSVAETAEEERYFLASSWTLMRRRFFKHKLAVMGTLVLFVIYVLAAFAGFFALADTFERNTDYEFAPPTRVRFFHDGRVQRPFVYGLRQVLDQETLAKNYLIDRTQVYPIRFFVQGHEYRFVGLFPSRLHLMGWTSRARSFRSAPTGSAATCTRACCRAPASPSPSVWSGWRSASCWAVCSAAPPAISAAWST